MKGARDSVCPSRRGPPLVKGARGAPLAGRAVAGRAMADDLDCLVLLDFQVTGLTTGGTGEIIEFPWIVFDLATGSVAEERRVV